MAGKRRWRRRSPLDIPLFDVSASGVDMGSSDDAVDLEVESAPLEQASINGDTQRPEDFQDDAVIGRAGIDAEARVVSETSGKSQESSKDFPGKGSPNLLAEQLAGGQPLLLLAKSHQLYKMMPSVARVAARTTKGRIGIGVTVRLPALTEAAATQFLSHFSASPVRIADPDLYKAPSHGGPDNKLSDQVTKRHQWLAKAPSPTGAPDTTWVKDILERQTQAGASVLLSATGWVGNANGKKELAAAMRWVSESSTHADKMPMFVNLTFDSAWLTNSTLRSLLLEEMVESGQRLWYLRFRWPVVTPRYGQLRDAAVLDGYRELVNTAALEDKYLVLPNSGMTGWLATALGAGGFSTGPSWAEQAYAQQQIMANRPNQPRPEPKRRFFERSVLHTVEQASHLAMQSESDYLLCRCRYCASLNASARSGGPWNKEVASMHYLLRVARATAVLSASNPRREALREVRRAAKFAKSVSQGPAALTGANTPAHLSEWERILS